MIEPGATIRRRTRDALYAALCAGAVVEALALLTTQIHLVRQHAPWREDPYDVLVSFSLFFVPALAVPILLRVQLCRRDMPQPPARLDDLLRVAGTLVALAGFTSVVEVVAIGFAVARNDLDRGVCAPAGLLAVALVLVANAARGLARVRGELVPWMDSSQTKPDWLDDFVYLTRRRRGIARVVHALDRRLRQRTATLFSAICLVCGCVVAIAIAVREDRWTLLVLVDVLVFAGGAFGFGALLNRSLHLVSGGVQSRGARICSAAAVAGALAFPAGLAFSDPLWRALRLGPAVRTPSQLLFLLIAVAGMTAAVTAALASVVYGPLRK